MSTFVDAGTPIRRESHLDLPMKQSRTPGTDRPAFPFYRSGT